MGRKFLNLDHSLPLVEPYLGEEPTTLPDDGRWAPAVRLAFLVLAAAAAWTIVIDSLDGLGRS